MRRPVSLTLVTFAALMAWASALAAGQAVVLGTAPPAAQTGPVPRTGLDGEWPGLAGALTRHGYAVVTGRTDGSGGLTGQLQDAGADRAAPLLVIALADLAADDGGVPRLVLSGGDLPLDGLTALVGGREGTVVVLLASRGVQDEVVAQRLLDVAPDDGSRERLIVVTMDPAYVPDFLDRGLLRKGVSLGAIRSVLPSGGQVAGTLSQGQGLSGIAEPAVTEDLAFEAGLWTAFSAMNDSEAFRRYLDLRPDGAHATEARVRLYALEYNSLSDAQLGEEKLALTDAQRADIQNDIAYLGFYEGRIDGVWGEESRAAIRDWQFQAGLPTTGHVNADQLAVLRAQVARKAEADRREAIDRERAEREFWLTTGQRGSQRELLAYLDRYPAGIFASIAQDRLDMLDEAIRAHARPGDDPALTAATDETAGTAEPAATRPRPRPQDRRARGQETAAPGQDPDPVADPWQPRLRDVQSQTMFK